MYMETLLHNFRVGLRMLARNRGMTLTVLLTFALGIGANTAIFTVVYATLLAPLPYPHPDQLVMVWSKIQNSRDDAAAADYIDWKQQNTVFQDLCAWTGATFNLTTRDQPEIVPAKTATPTMLQMIGQPLYMGRYFLPEEGTSGREHVVILTYKLWQKLGADPHVLGSTLRLNGEPFTVVGVQQRGNFDRQQAELTVPLVFKPDQVNRNFHWLFVMGRLKPDVTLQQAQQNMDAVTDHLAKSYPNTNDGWGASVEPLKNDFLPKERVKMLWLLLGAVGFVLLIACLNVANLLLSRGISRQKELAVRGALGAGRATVFNQLLTESLLLAVAGGILGVGFGYGLLQGLLVTMPSNTLPIENELRLNLPVLLFTLLATTLAGFLAGSAPAWLSSRVDPAELLRGRTGTSRSHHLQRVPVVCEFALALALLAGAGLTIHSFWNLAHVDIGLKTDHVLTFFLNVPESRSKDSDWIVAYYRDILARVRAVPGVTNASAETGMPLYGGGFGLTVALEGDPIDAHPAQLPDTDFGLVTPDFFQTFGIRLLSGRAFTDQDTSSSIKVAVVNQDFVNKFLKGKDPLRQRVLVQQIIPGVTKFGPREPWQIVGTYQNVHSAVQRDENPQMLVPFWQTPWPEAGFGVRTAENPTSMLTSIAAAIHSVDPVVALAYPKTMDAVRNETTADEGFTLTLFGSFAALALFLAALGIYGVISFSVANRGREIALRMALGATPNRIIGLVLRDGLLLAAVGLVLGLIGAYLVGRAMQSVLFGVPGADFSVFGSVVAILVAAAVLACFLPARRAAKLEPMPMLRAE
jgi:putative ABC transport system permease protein